MSCTVTREMKRLSCAEVGGRRGAVIRVGILHNKDQNCEKPKSQDIYRRLLGKLYNFLPKQTNSTFNQVVPKRWFMSCTTLPPSSLSQMIWETELSCQEDKTAVVAETITGDLNYPNRWEQDPHLQPAGPYKYTPSTVTPCCSLLLGKVEKCADISKRPGDTPVTPATPAPTTPHMHSKGQKYKLTRVQWAHRGYKNYSQILLRY
ncbi:ribosomal protein L18-like [Lutra lutra]|uniref:ribosomal protein L18-like n=1 Tax=Lutra lutra TaxID=9657 RepID=UPI001FD4F3AB|nr:ribosomal protein L18-like [Lutra lutra]